MHALATFPARSDCLHLLPEGIADRRIQAPGRLELWIRCERRPLPVIGRGSDGVYVGEASQLKRRGYHYSRPGPSQMTNIRLKEERGPATDDTAHWKSDSIPIKLL